MNYENTKLDLSEYSEEERLDILECYAEKYKKEFDYESAPYCFYFCDSYSVSITHSESGRGYFEKIKSKELRPIKHETWGPIKSVDNVEVGDVIDLEDHSSVVFIGEKYTVISNAIDECVVMNKDLILIEKRITTYTFEPARDDIDSLAEKLRETHLEYFNTPNSVPWNQVVLPTKNHWRVMAKLAKEELINDK